MNNKRAKLLRKLAKDITHNAEISVENVYEDKSYNKQYLSDQLDGQGNRKVINYSVYTRALGQCERAVYQRLKEEMK